MEYEQFSLSRVAASQDKPIDRRSFTQSQNRYSPSEHCQSPFAGASSTYCAGPENQRCHPQGSSSYSSPAPVAVDHTQGSLSEAFVNQNYHGSQNYPQSHNRHPSSEHSQNPYAEASSMYYGGFVNQECHPQGSSSYGLPAPVAVDYSQGNHPAAFLNPNNQGSQTLPQSQNRQPSSENDHNPYAGASSMHYSGLFYQGYHPRGHRHSSPKHGQNPYAGASSIYYGGFRHQECYPQGSSSHGLPAPVAVDYSQGNHPAAFLNPNNQGSQTLPQSQKRQPCSENDQNPYAGASSMHYRGLFCQGYHPRGRKRHSSPKHGQNPYAGASSIYYGGFRHQERYPQGPSSYGLPAPVAVDYCQGNHPAAFLNPNNQGSQTLPQSQKRQPCSENDQNPYAGASSTHYSGLSYQGYPQGSEHCLVVEHLQDEYIRRSNVKPLLWDSDIQLPIDDVYTRLQIKWRRKAYFKLTEKEVHMYEIFKPAEEGEKGARMVLVEGNPGIGKTTFCLKIARDWAQKLVPIEFHFPAFKFLFLLKCCDIHKDTKDMVQAIDEQVLHDDMKNKTRFLNYIRDERNQNEILLILDGLDELPEASGKVDAFKTFAGNFGLMVLGFTSPQSLE
ncbi:uncharacterized protein LOC111343950 [Stylophora pistillata]|uniref:uncharacterized protein LOC111343950 n=1 Tax=Stylophora pistillata TaxID=50429 RepID=UPI000C03B9A9|nr:uncharacterized protein LOC111343950 [Stylophora pistillata]